jgi:serine/threonine-protein kinase
VVALVAGLVLALGAGGYAAWQVTRDGGPGTPGGSAQPIPPAARDGRIPDGYAACGETLCPTEPMCWRGLVVISGEGRPPAKEDCAQPHYWETFAAVSLPADAVTDSDLTTLIERSDIAEVCSAGTMAGRTRAGVSTEGWRMEAWPIPADAYTVLVHCLAGSPDGETPGTAFQPA